MDNFTYHRATLADLDALAELRALVLHTANELPDEVEIPQEVRDASRDFYSRRLTDGSHVAYIVYDGEVIVGAGGVTFYEVMPMCSLPTGNCAYIQNMYTHPDYRRRGIAWETLTRLVAEARRRGLSSVGLEATDMGKPLYEKFGFEVQQREMRLEF